MPQAENSLHILSLTCSNIVFSGYVFNTDYINVVYSVNGEQLNILNHFSFRIVLVIVFI